MTLRKWFHLFWTTMVIGMAITLIIGSVMYFSDQDYRVPGFGAVGFNLLQMTLAGATISVLSQMGFFAYLIIKWIAVSLFRSAVIWEWLQLLLVVVAVIDLAYLRYTYFGEGSGFGGYLILPLIMLAVGIVVSYWKVKLTSRGAFIPTLFVMTALTMIEAVPIFRENNITSLIFTLIPLMACNAWQILILHKILGTKNTV